LFRLPFPDPCGISLLSVQPIQKSVQPIQKIDQDE
jgi:hypothetical protein